MEQEGRFAPETLEAARERYEALGSTAQVVVREVAKAMELDRETYRERVTSDVIETAREVLFAESLAVTVGTREEFDAWRVDHPDYEVCEIGSENVRRVAWHAAPFAETVVAATFQDEREAAVGTLRRQAFGDVYRDALREN
ncbi:DUF5809 family protein [Halapricum desulfuricans]|uniref:Uncharacterized protein n=1 Tax=Halapricum desulfuricans TaxID=2841257 RepID=A0A897MZF7_9EURY|nr:DUF5809 family protein [Halapricum desulfuricans]QSG05834.1 Uncharacterized protein HSR121_1491 [Halapricum desulfuricans]